MNQGRRNRGVRATEEGIKILQERRHSKGWTLQKLANEAGLALDTVKRLIKRVANVDRESVGRIAYALDLQPIDFIPLSEWNPVDPKPEQPLDYPLEETGRARICISDRGGSSSGDRGLEPNLDLAQQLGSELELRGQDVFIATEEMRHPANWFQRFTEELEQCDCYVLLLSPQAVVSEVITEELRYVWELYHAQKKPTILSIQVGADVVLQPDVCHYLAGFESRKWISANDTPEIVEAILNSLANPEKRLPIEDPPSTLPETGEAIPTPIPAEPEHPTGQVLLASTFYMERPPIEVQCYQEIVHPGALIRIKAPRQMGKTSLMARILDQARKQGHRTVHLSFQLAPSDVLSNVDKLMRWFCLCVSRSLRLPNQLADYWDDIFDGNYNSTSYFEQYLLAATNSPLVIGLDEVDRVFAYPEIANDFFGLLRAWYEKAKYGDRDSDTWKKLRLVVSHSTEVYIPMNLNQSPFNVGLSIELPEFTVEQVQDLTQRYQLDWTLNQIETLMRLVGGHPYLVRVAMYHVAHQMIAFEQVLEQAATEAGIYSDHLRRHLWNLGKHPELANAFSDVVTARASVSLKSILAFRLNSFGLVTIASNRVTPRCELYRQYFCEYLAMDKIELT
ncbi:MAG: AAA-like domain-containing protein [Phormidesmis sp. CAN_BIN44]|nr:AAA-like domain-containing protein [Phormidesmis sp. CAN_BIN44]